MRLLKVQVQSQDCPWLWQGKGLGFGKTRQVLLLLWKYPVWFSRQVAIRDLAVELRCVQSPRHSKILKGCGGFKHEPALCIWWMYLKPHQHHNLARNQCTRRYLIDDISVRQYSTRGPKVKRNFWQGLFLMQLWHQLLDSLQSNWLVCWTGWLWQATLADAHVSTRSQPWCKHAGSW